MRDAAWTDTRKRHIAKVADRLVANGGFKSCLDQVLNLHESALTIRPSLFSFLLALLLAGCGAKGSLPTGATSESSDSPPVVQSSGSENEGLMYSETARFSGILGVHVAADLTEYQYKIGANLAAGWYVGTYTKGSNKGRGTAFYYRPYVLNFGKVVNGGYWETATNVAGHETCHAETGPAHDHAHWLCMSKIAAPTYPDPGDGVASSAGIGPGISCGIENSSGFTPEL